MFKQRVLSILILAPLVLLLLFYANEWVVGAVIFLIVLGCGYEWLQLIPIKNIIGKWLFIFGLLVNTYLVTELDEYGMVIGLLMWLGILLCVIYFPRSQRLWGYSAIVFFWGWLLLPLFANSLLLIFLMEKGRALVVYLLALVWAADIGAYLAGRQWGRHKLTPQVSPGKSWEGALGGVVTAMIIASLAAYYFHPYSLLRWFLMAIAVTAISILGDLFISMLKRRVHIKDTGSLIPGHGGILDRLDSLIAASVLFYAAFYFVSFGL